MNLLSVQMLNVGATTRQITFLALALSYECLVMPSYRILTPLLPTVYCERTKTKAWLNKNGELHREDGPAFVTSSFQVWFYNGLRHRNGNQPAEIDQKYLGWFVHGQMYREDYVDLEGKDKNPIVVTEHWKNSICHSERKNEITIDQFWQLRAESLQSRKVN